MNGYTHVKHGFSPVFDADSKILILGTMPSVKSRENAFYYGHPRNRFWRLVSELLCEPLPRSTAEKTEMLLKYRIALWDVITECDIVGSSDSSIKNAVAADLSLILDKTDIKCIFANGSTAKKLYDKYQKAMLGKEIVLLPSTSPANAAWNMERLKERWKIILEYI